MPSKSKKQLNLFILVKSYYDNGAKGLVDKWKSLYPGRKINKKDIEKIINISERINPADLEDMASGIEGDNIFGDNKEIKVGYWMKFDSDYSTYNGEIKNSTFIAKIKRVNPSIKLVNFNSEDLYTKFGEKTSPVRRRKISPEQIWLDYAYFDNIKETAKTKDELVMKNEIRKIVRKVLSETYTINENEEGLLNKIKKFNEEEEVEIKSGMEVVKKSDESRGKVLKAITDNKTVPAQLKLVIQWTNGDLSGTEQAVDLDDIEAL